MIKIVNRFLCWINGIDADELDKLAQAKHRDMPWHDWARKESHK